MQPIRGKRSRQVAHNPWEGTEHDLGQRDEIHILGDNGGIESYDTGRARACDCGCLAQPGGFCAECGALVCKTCFGHCRCGKPLCPRHSVFMDGPIRGRLCCDCHEALTRSKRLRRVGRALLSPFVAFEDRDGTK